MLKHLNKQISIINIKIINYKYLQNAHLNFLNKAICLITNNIS